MAQVLHMLRATVGARYVAIPWRRATGVYAAGMLLVILVVNLLILPIPDLGIKVNPQTHHVEHVDLGSSAERAGVQVGDRVVRLYDRSMTDVLESVTVLRWIPPRDQPVPIVVERGEQTLTLAVVQDPPSLASQLTIIAIAVLALGCWLTGYVIGVGQHQTVLESQLVAFFWLSMAGVLGSITFAIYTSIPIFIALLWFVIGVLMPLAIYIHLWFPPRTTTPARTPESLWYVWGASLLINGGTAVGIWIVDLPLVDLLSVLLVLLPVAIIVGLGGSAWVLRRAYRTTTVAHTRRQIRLIGIACAVVSCAWLVFYLVPMVTLGHSLAPRDTLILVSGLVPLAYLIGTITPDLYRIDRLGMRCLQHLSAVTVLSTILLVIAARYTISSPTGMLVLAICFITLYRPLQQGMRWLFSARSTASQLQDPLDVAIQQLSSTLDAANIANALIDGVHAAFGRPALALYLGDIYGTNVFHLQAQERFDGIPSTLPTGALIDMLCQGGALIDGRTLHQRLQESALTAEERHLVAHPTSVIWCPIRHSRGHLLGLTILGRKPDVDPYRREDLIALQRMMGAAALALANSAAYARQLDAEATIRSLYQHLQTVQDATARKVSRQIHDEIINVHVRLDIESLKKIAASITEPALCTEVSTVLDSLRTISSDLRRICEDLHPTGLDDPYGLAGVLRAQVHKLHVRWRGHCEFVATGEPCPLAAQVQHEALRITKEALTNAMTHSRAQRISVQLQYPATAHAPVRLIISDDGNVHTPIMERPGHWGLRYMEESARAVGGTLHIAPQAGGGTVVSFEFFPKRAHTDASTGAAERDSSHAAA